MVRPGELVLELGEARRRASASPVSKKAAIGSARGGLADPRVDPFDRQPDAPPREAPPRPSRRPDCPRRRSGRPAISPPRRPPCAPIARARARRRYGRRAHERCRPPPGAQATIPHSSPSAVAGGSTPITTRLSASRGRPPLGRDRSIRALRPQRARDVLDQLAEQLLPAEPGLPAWTSSTHAQEGGGDVRIVAARAPGQHHFGRSPAPRAAPAPASGVVVTTTCGRAPARRLSIRLSHAASARLHLASSSHQAK